MYFTDITNPELQSYSTDIVDTFSISLTRALTSNLFKVETIISDKLYKIYPLFYCDSIQSSNPDDKLLGNRLVICTKNNSTFLKFIREGDEVNKSASNFEWYYKGIGDTLSDAEFNGYVQLLKKGENSELIEIDNLDNAKSGVYQFDINATVLDNGILVTDDTSINVTLKNPVFPNSKYSLKLKALNISDVNLIDRTPSHLTYKNISVDLIKNEPVTIPLTTLDVEDVILFDAEVIVDHNQPVIILPDVIELTVAGDMFVTKQVTLSAQYTHGSLPVQGETVSFYNGSTLLGTGTTDSDGVATYSYTPSSTGLYEFKAVLDNTVSNVVSKQVSLIPTEVSIDGKSWAYVDDTVNITGVLLDYHETPLSSKTVKLLDNGTVLATTTTNSSGEYSFTLDTSTAGTFNLQTSFQASGYYDACKSEIISVRVLKMPVNFYLESTRASNTNTFTITGTITDKNDAPVANEQLEYIHRAIVLGTVTSNSNGEFSFNVHISNRKGVEQVFVGVAWNSRKYQRSDNVSVLSKYESEFSEVTRTLRDGQYVYHAKLTTLAGNPLTGKNVTATIGGESQDNVTNSDGEVVWVRSTSQNFTVVFLEDDDAIGCTGGLS